MLRFQFLNNALGALVIDPDDPIGVNELTKTIKRSSDHDGIIFEVIFDLEFIKGARAYLKLAFESDGGVDCVVIVNLYKDNPNTRKWVLYSEGTVNFNKFDLGEDKIAINIEQTGIQRRVTNLIDTDVDLETLESENGGALPEMLVLDQMLYHSKTILKITKATPSKEGEGDDAAYVERQFLNVFEIADLPGLSTTYRERIIFGQMDTVKAEPNELEESFQTPFGYTDLTTLGIEGPATAEETRTWLLANPDLRAPFNVHRFDEAGLLDITGNIGLLHEIEAIDVSGDVDVCGDAALGEIEIFYWLELRDSANVIKFLINLGTCDMGPCVDNTRTGPIVDIDFEELGVNVEKNDKLYYYHTVRIYGDYENNDTGSESVSHHFRITAQEGTFLNLRSKTSAPTSNAKTILLYEAFKKCCQFYTNEVDCFYSDLLGRTDLERPGEEAGTFYPIDGEGALIGVTNGANLRALDKPIFANLNDLIEFTNSLFCVGFGFETFPDGRQRFRLEKRSHFYDKSNKILSLGAVYNIRKTIDSKRYYNQIEYGYASKIDVNETNAIDAFNSKRRHTIPIVNTKNQLKVATKVKADGYQIENARRLKFSTKDGKYDDDLFIVVVIRDALTFKTKKDEGYELIENVFDSPTGYNYDISPGRILRNWFKIIASALIYSKTKVIKFSYGEANFLMRTKKTGEPFTVEENGNVDLTDVEPDYDCFIYHLLDVDITDDLVQAICDNPYGYIEFEDRFGEVMQGFISDTGIEHDPNKGKADFRLLKVFRP